MFDEAIDEGNARGSDLKIVIISDGTGETASLLTKAATLQFSDKDIQFIRYKNIRTRDQIAAIFQDAGGKTDLVVYTIVSPEQRAFIREKSEEIRIPAIDLLGPLLNSLSLFFEAQPKEKPGLFHEVNDRYFNRISAMEYTIKHDDGKDVSELEKADIIILGISRTSKTPLSMFLSHQGWRVCNVPLVRGVPISKEIFAADQDKIVGLTIQADVLQQIRKVRLERLAQEPNLSRSENYASLESVSDEIEYANSIFRQNKRWPVFDVSGKALEETAAEIIRLMTARKRMSMRKKFRAKKEPS
jgi:regulator of PEP synthase PpsR (kinase-PPPase family)